MINASVICMNPLNLKSDFELLLESGIYKFHFDVMDGALVPRYGLYPEILQSLFQQYNFEADCHFMVSNVLDAIKEWSSYAIPAKISYHYNSNIQNLSCVTNAIRSIGSKSIVAFDLDITLNQIEAVINARLCDGIMLLSIRPGILKQMPNPQATISRLSSLKSLGILDQLDYVQVDGGVNLKTIPSLLRAGCNELICGSSTLFNFPKTTKPETRSDRIMNNINHIKEVMSYA